MPLYARISGQNRQIARLRAMRNFVLSDVAILKNMTGGVIKVVFTSTGSLSVTAPNVTNPPGSGDNETDICQTTVTGGVAPYSYAWTHLGGSAPNITILSPTASGTRFESIGWSTGQTANFRVTVTDFVGTIATKDVTARWNSAS